MNESHREQSRRDVREVKGWGLARQERQVEARKWRKQKLIGRWKGRQGKRIAERKIQEIDGHGTGVSRETEREREFNEGNLKASFKQQLAGGRA